MCTWIGIAGAVYLIYHKFAFCFQKFSYVLPTIGSALQNTRFWTPLFWYVYELVIADERTIADAVYVMYYKFALYFKKFSCVLLTVCSASHNTWTWRSRSLCVHELVCWCSLTIFLYFLLDSSSDGSGEDFRNFFGDGDNAYSEDEETPRHHPSIPNNLYS